MHPNRMFLRWLNKSQFTNPCYQTFWMYWDALYAMQASKDGSKVAAAGFDMSKGYTNDIIQIWDIKTGKSTGTIHVPQESCCIAFSYDGKLLYFVNSTSANVIIYNSSSGNLLTTEPLEKFNAAQDQQKVVEAVANPNRMEIAITVGVTSSTTYFYDLSFRCKSVHTHSERVFSLLYATSDLIIEKRKDNFTAWNVALNERIAFPVDDEKYSLAVSNDGHLVATATTTKVTLYDVVNRGNALWSCPQLNVEPLVVFSSDDRKIFALHDEALKEASVSGNGNDFTIVADPMPGFNRIWAPHPDLLIIGSNNYDGQQYFKLWNLKYPPLKKAGRYVNFTKNGSEIIAFGNKDEVRFFDCKIPSMLKEVKTVKLEAMANVEKNKLEIIFSPCKNFFAVSWRPIKKFMEDFKVFSSQTLEVLYERTQSKFLCFSPDGSKICFSAPLYFDRQLIIYEFQKKNQDTALALPYALSSDKVISASFSPDANFLLIGSTRGSQLYNFSTKKWITLSNKMEDTLINIMQVAFSANGHLVVACDFPNLIVYDLQKKEHKLHLKISCKFAQFDPNNQNVIIIGHLADPKVQWWTLDGKLLATYYLADNPSCICFDPPNNLVLISDVSGFSYLLTPLEIAEKASYEAQPDSIEAILNPSPTPFSPSGIFKAVLQKVKTQPCAKFPGIFRLAWKQMYRPINKYTLREVNIAEVKELPKEEYNSAFGEEFTWSEKNEEDCFEGREEMRKALNDVSRALIAMKSEKASDETMLNAMQTCFDQIAGANHFGATVWDRF